jgi:hypothetical protein
MTEIPADPQAVWQRSVQFNLQVAYDEPFLPSPRHRKQQTRRASLELRFGIPHATRREAPIVFMTREGHDVRAYRRFEGKLYCEAKEQKSLSRATPRPVTLEELIEKLRVLAHGYGSFATVNARLEARLMPYLCVGERLYEETKEPLLEIYSGELCFEHKEVNQAYRWAQLYNLGELEVARIATKRGVRDDVVVYVFDGSAITRPSHGEWYARHREARLEAALREVQRVTKLLTLPDRRTILERSLVALQAA